jgi:anti-sigma regulatory factor (Ser/Thr protein kinase)
MLVKVTDYTSLQTALEALCQYLTSQNVEQEKVFDCKLVACELLGNVLKHGDGKATLQGELQDGYIVVKVSSKQTFVLPEQITCSGTFAEGGRGLFLVNTLCNGQVFTEDTGIVVKIKL